MARPVGASAGSDGPAPNPRGRRAAGGEARRARSRQGADTEQSRALARARTLRTAFAPKDVVIRTDPQMLPETARESAGSSSSSRAWRAGPSSSGCARASRASTCSSPREPEVMIEDDIVRYAERFARDARPPHDIVYVHDFDHPEAPLAADLARRVPDRRSSRRMDALIERLQHEIPTVVEGDDFKRAQAQLAGGARGEESRGHPPSLESLAKTLGFGVRAVQAASRRFRSCTASRERRAVRRARRFDERALDARPRASSRARSRRRRSSFASRAQGSKPRGRGASRRRASGDHREAMERLDASSGPSATTSRLARARSPGARRRLGRSRRDGRRGTSRSNDRAKKATTPSSRRGSTASA